MSNAGDADAPDPPDPVAAGETDTSQDGSVTVLGTAHVSQASVDDVRDAVAEEQPDVVAVELDEGRYNQMQGGAPDDIESQDLLSGNTVFQFLAYWMLSYVQSRLGDQFDIEPGADMRAAIDAAERNGSGVSLVDRDIQVTIQRFWNGLSFTEKLKMVGGLALGITDPRTIGLTFGAVIGLLTGLLFAVFIAPMVGLGDFFLLGITESAALQTVGALGLGTIAGAFVGLLFLPSIRAADRYGGEFINGVSARTLVGIAIGVGGSLALVETGTFVGPISATLFENAGSYSLRSVIGALTGLGVGISAGALLGILFGLLSGDVEEVDEIDIEEMTDGDVVSAMMEEFRQFSPRGANALIDERDAYIAHNLQTLREHGYDVLAVVGAGHRAGIERYLEHPDELPPMESITGTASSRRFSPLKILGYLAMVSFVGFFFLLMMAGVQDTFLLQLFAAWFLFNGIFAFTLARLAGARWTSAGVGGCVAWLTSINPLLAPGWFAGYVELKHRPVNVRDIQTLNEIVGDADRPISEAIDDMFNVPLFRLIMIVALTNIGSLIATILFPFVVLEWLAPGIGGVDALLAELLHGAENSLELLRGLLT
ncbi:TraB/GumN family protein [Natrialba asiatica]|uniref:TraB determinant protein n=1 Tax=Natrialba asiatica (strain ATCC 700177 / DSM 12278 / JCM 9576 / FERM P-10747 / NBRC 102637 / 172P1) TaxID=29540 RepID=M0ASU6_NATA1|nr:TraB/GumN family protein [Natrialba asiatica]ELZ00998.1 TraB determinant protein [Natrialba asiatica DSM 12278]